MTRKCRYCGVILPSDWRDAEYRKLCRTATPEVRYIHSGIEQRGIQIKKEAKDA